MKLNRCPVCHCCFDVMAMAQDEATQQVLVRLARFDTLTGIALLGYLSLFCPEKSQLSAGRTLTLLNELEKIENGNWERLTIAMATTVEIKQAQKRDGQVVQQFKSHAYLKKVLADLPADAGSSVTVLAGDSPSSQQKSKTRSAIETLDQLKD